MEVDKDWSDDFHGNMELIASDIDEWLLCNSERAFTILTDPPSVIGAKRSNRAPYDE
jgi:hypothetical protein